MHALCCNVWMLELVLWSGREDLEDLDAMLEIVGDKQHPTARQVNVRRTDDILRQTDTSLYHTITCEHLHTIHITHFIALHHTVTCEHLHASDVRPWP